MAIKIDTHVHADEQKIALDPFARLFHTRESYIRVEEVHKLAKESGMDYVTITSHNNLTPSKQLVDCFPQDSVTGCEYTIKASSQGHEIDIVCLGINEDAHEELIYLKEKGVEEFVRYCIDSKIAHFFAHPFWRNTKKIAVTPRQLNNWFDYFTVIETINGDLQIENHLAEIIAKKKGKAGSGGSDAHSIHGIGKTYTVAEKASNLEGFLTELREGRVYAKGDNGSIEKKASEYYDVIWNYLKREKHWKRYLTLASLAVPLVNLGIVAGALIIPYAKAVSDKISSETNVKNFAKEYFEYICQGECSVQQERVDEIEQKMEALLKKQKSYEERIIKKKSEYDNILDDLQKKSFIGRIPFFGRLILRFKKYRWYRWLFDLDY